MPMSRAKAIGIVKEMTETFPWFADCVKKIDLTFVGKTFDLRQVVCDEKSKDDIVMSEEKIGTRKVINFDLYHAALQREYLGKNGEPKDYTGAYHELRRFMLENGLAHKQGSGYLSTGRMSYSKILDIAEKMTDQFPWLAKSVKAIDVTYVGKIYDLLPMVIEHRRDIVYSKAVEVNTKGDTVLGKGHPDALLDEIPKEEWPYIADVRDGIVVIDDKAMEEDGYLFDRGQGIVRDDRAADKMMDKAEPERDALNILNERDETRLGDEYGD